MCRKNRWSEAWAFAAQRWCLGAPASIAGGPRGGLWGVAGIHQALGVPCRDFLHQTERLPAGLARPGAAEDDDSRVNQEVSMPRHPSLDRTRRGLLAAGGAWAVATA